MIVDNINKLKRKLENQIIKKDSYDNIYETSVAIDKLLIEYYNEQSKFRKDLSY